MRKLILATLLMSALTAGAQGFVTHRAKVAKQQSEIQAKKAATRGQSVAPERQRGYFFVNCEQGADAQQVARQLKANGAEVRMVKGDLILLDAPYSKLDTLASTKGVWKIDVGPKVGRRTDISRKVTQAGDVINGTGGKLPQAYTGKGVIVGVIDDGFDATHPMFKDKDGNLRINRRSITSSKSLARLLWSTRCTQASTPGTMRVGQAMTNRRAPWLYPTTCPVEVTNTL